MNTTWERLSLRVVGEHEAPAVFGQLREAAVWLASRSIDYWQCWHSPPDGHARWVSDGIRAGEFRFAVSDDRIVGMFRLQWEDPLFWSAYDRAGTDPASEPGQAGYVHSLTTNRRLAGTGLGRAVLRKIEETCSSNGRSYLRLDCGEVIIGLHRFYEGFGFVRVGNVSVFGESLVLFQRRIDDRTGREPVSPV